MCIRDSYKRLFRQPALLSPVGLHNIKKLEIAESDHAATMDYRPKNSTLGVVECFLMTLGREAGHVKTPIIISLSP